jgi:hypothetical protein
MTVDEIVKLAHDLRWHSKLTAVQTEIATLLGQARYDNARANHCQADPLSTIANNIRGTRTELAASLLVNVYWNMHVGRQDEPDIGGLIEVRSGTASDHRLIVKPRDIDKYPDNVPFMLMLDIPGAPTIRCAGWLQHARAAREFPLIDEFGPKAHYVPQSALCHPMWLESWMHWRYEADSRLAAELIAAARPAEPDPGQPAQW